MNYADRTVGMGSTTISIPEDLADELYSRKGRGESYADVIYQLMNAADQGNESAADVDETPAQHVEESRPAEPDQTREPSRTTDEMSEGAPADLDTLVDTVAEDALPGSGAKLEARREALRAVVDFLREQGRATPQAFKNDVYPEHTAYYTDGQDPARSWWKNCIYKGLRELAERDERVVKADQSGEWSFRGA